MIDDTTRCPECERTFASNRGVRIHFGARHRGLPYPFKMSWVENGQRKQRLMKTLAVDNSSGLVFEPLQVEVLRVSTTGDDW
jgi:hypothetical protein